MRIKRFINSILVALFFLPMMLNAQNGKISGYMFGDYYMQLSNPDKAVNDESRNGFQFRRIYFTYDNKLDDNFSIRFRMEMKSSETSNMEPFVKNAYLTWKNLIPHAKVNFGLTGTPTWSYSEKIWGYRAVEKTIMDLHKISSSADMGISAKGQFGESGTMNYFVHFGNGTGKKGEKDKYKKIYVSLPIILQKSFYVVPYIDTEGADNGKSKSTVAVFAGYKKGKVSGGFEFFQKTSNKALAGDADLKQSGFSVFGKLKTTDKVSLFARFDSYDPNTDTNDDASSLIIGGLDYLAGKNVHIMPNIKIESYELSGLDSNTLAQLTFFYKY